MSKKPKMAIIAVIAILVVALFFGVYLFGGFEGKIYRTLNGVEWIISFFAGGSPDNYLVYISMDADEYILEVLDLDGETFIYHDDCIATDCHDVSGGMGVPGPVITFDDFVNAVPFPLQNSFVYFFEQSEENLLCPGMVSTTLTAEHNVVLHFTSTAECDAWIRDYYANLPERLLEPRPIDLNYYFAEYPPICGNEICEEPVENEITCPEDCGEPEPPECGNNICEEGENPYNCPEDCGEPGPVCGDNICEGDETPYNCPEDCGEPAEATLWPTMLGLAAVFVLLGGAVFIIKRRGK
jgi:hypothetical protein